MINALKQKLPTPLLKTNKSYLLRSLIVLTIGLCGYWLITSYYTSKQEQLTFDSADKAMNYARDLLTDYGTVRLENGELFAGETRLNNSTFLVNKVQTITGFGCTLFQGNTRVSTTASAKNSDKIAIGTTANAEITKDVFGAGNTFKGTTETIGKSWLIIYEPLRNEFGDVVGMVAVFKEHKQFLANLNDFKLIVAITLFTFILIVLFLMSRTQARKTKLEQATQGLSENHEILLSQNEELEKLIFVVNEIEQTIAIVGKDDRIQWVNKSFQKKLQYSTEEAIGNKISDIVGGPETDRLTVKKMDESIFWRQKPINSTILQYRKDRTSYWARVYLTPLFDKKNEIKGYVAISLDISAEKEAIESLQKSEANIRQIGETIDDMVYLYNIAYRKYEYISPKCNSVLGANQSFFYSGLSYKEIYVLDRHKSKLVNAEKELRNGAAYDIEYEVLIDNEVKWIRERSHPIYNDRGEIIKHSGICSDITKSKIIEAQLNRSHKNMKILSQIGFKITEELSIIRIIENVHEQINEVMQAHGFAIGIIDTDKHELFFPKFIENEAVYENISHSLDEHILATIAINEDKEIIINDFVKEIGLYTNSALNHTAGDDPESLIYLPLKFRGEIIGVITVQSLKKRAYDNEQIELLRSLSVYVANGLANAQLNESLNKNGENGLVDF